MGCIYKITHTESGRCYIGKTVKQSWRDRYYGNLSRVHPYQRYLYNAVKKYGAGAFEAHDIETDIPNEQLNDREIAQVSAHRSNESQHGFNLTGGGGGMLGYIASPETRIKLSKAFKGRKISREQIERHRAAMKGRTIPVWHRQKISAALRAFYTGNVEARRAISARTLGRRHTPEAREKMSIAAKANPSAGRKIEREFIHPTRGEFKGTAVQIAKIEGVNPSNFISLAKGKLKSVRGWVMKGAQFYRRTNRKFEWLSPSGETVIATRLEAEKISGLNYSSIRALGLRQVKVSSGWRFVGDVPLNSQLQWQ